MSLTPPGRQLSLFGAEAADPSPADLAGLLAGPGRVTRMGGTARVSVVVDAPWRVHVLAAEFAARGLTANWAPAADSHLAVRTSYARGLAPLATAWLRGAVKRPPAHFHLDGPRLRLWVAAAGTPGPMGFLLRLGPSDEECWDAVGAALAAIGLPPVLVGPRAGQAPGERAAPPAGHPTRPADHLTALAGHPATPSGRPPAQRAALQDERPEQGAPVPGQPGTGAPFGRPHPDPAGHPDPGGQHPDPTGRHLGPAGQRLGPAGRGRRRRGPEQQVAPSTAEADTTGHSTPDPETALAGGPAYRIIGRRRLRRLAELVGERPPAAPADAWPA